MYRMFLSGKIEDSTTAQNAANFAKMGRFIGNLDIDVVNPFDILPLRQNGRYLPIGESLILLGECDGVYMSKDWMESDYAAIIELTAKRNGLDVWYEEMNDAIRVQKAILSVTGMRMAEYTTESRAYQPHCVRILFCHYCDKAGMSPTKIGKLINRDRTTVLHDLDIYPDQRIYKDFREMDDKIAAILDNDKDFGNGN